MGLFNFANSYNKPGPGVEKDELPKAAPIRFFEIYFRKFSKFVQANLVFALPAFVAFLLMACIYLFVPHIFIPIPNSEITVNLTLYYLVPVPLIFLYPCTAGLTYITRNFSREEHAFIWSDFWDTVKSNWKYFLCNGVLIYVVYFLLSFSMVYYRGRATANSMFYVPFWLCVILAAVFVIAQYYIPMMFVTFDLNFGQVYKNSLIFILAGFGRNIIITAVLALLAILIPFPNTTLGFTIFLVLALFWLFSFVSYLVNFTIYPAIDRYMIQPYQKQIAAAKKPEEKITVPFTADEVKKSEYVYHNGKLVKRSEVEETE